MPKGRRRNVSPEVRAKAIANLRPFKKGQSGNPSGRPKGVITFESRLREAFSEPPSGYRQTITDLVLAEAMNPDSPNWQFAVKFCASYGIGLPKVAMDDDTVKRLASEMMERAFEQARARRVAALEAELTDKAPGS